MKTDTKDAIHRQRPDVEFAKVLRYSAHQWRKTGKVEDYSNIPSFTDRAILYIKIRMSVSPFLPDHDEIKDS